MLSIVLHTFFLALSVGLTFLWTQNPRLTPYNLQAIGLLVLAYFTLRFITNRLSRFSAGIDAVIFTSLILFLVITTGGVTSPLFFLLFFLLFALSLLFGSVQVIVISLFTALLFALQLRFELDNLALVNLITLVLISPLASLFGRKYLDVLQARGRIKLLSRIVENEETQTLIWLSTAAKPTLINLLDTTSLIIGSNLLPFALQQKLKMLHRDLIALHQSASILEKDIDELSDDD